MATASSAAAAAARASASPPRARDLGIPFEGTPGPLNAITDVQGVAVGQVTLIEDLKDGHKVRTGVTAILPRGHDTWDLPVFAGWFSQNGNGEMTGTHWIDEGGELEGPVMLTNTHSVGLVRDAVIAERVKAGHPDATGYWWSLPVVAETWDGDLNDANGFHVRPEHVAKALTDANGGPVAEGNVGGGTGMICHEFKCGIGTSSRKVNESGHDYTVGVLVQANYGVRDPLRIAGVPVGQYLRDDRVFTDPKLWGSGTAAAPTRARLPDGIAHETGSIIVVVATDAPLLPHQLKRVARRATLALGRMGSYSGNGSGDLFVAFSTANRDAMNDKAQQSATFVGNDHIDPVFEATVQATEEAIVNAMIAAKDMQGDSGHYAKAIPHDRLVALLKQFNRWQPPSK
ncbi:MAG TPA: P1 family peptidase [Xanthomonadaceae bacterium]